MVGGTSRASISVSIRLTCHLLLWEPTQNQCFRCLVCPHHDPIEARRIPEHEQTNRHERNLNRASGSVPKTSNTSNANPSTSGVPLEHVGGALSQTLAQLAKGKGSRYLRQQYDYVDEGTGVVDWSSDMMDFNTQMQQPLDVQTTAQLAKNLQAYLKEEGDLEHDSDDDLEERSPASDSDSSETEDDILRHVPRCSFSKKQNAAIHWAMLALGLNDLPSDRVMDDIDKALQKMCGVESIRYLGKLGHVYYVNDLAGIIAQEMANPTVCKNLHFLPEDTKPSLSQAWQASRWLTELDSDLTTP
ncbi:hypothetical protein B0H14DRAFT_2565445 [Mycena olivaceomarginata]|nr:hypothetical protein B0H14DRAFT_2565445 [Mycena olivaceomarginata]